MPSERLAPHLDITSPFGDLLLQEVLGHRGLSGKVPSLAQRENKLPHLMLSNGFFRINR